MSRAIDLVVFDIAGTTIKDNGEIVTALAKAMAKYGYMVPASKIRPLMGYKKPQAIEKLLNKYEDDPLLINDDLINKVHEAFLFYMLRYYEFTSELEALPFVEDVFSFLKENGVKVALDTGFSSDITNVIIDRMGWVESGLVDFVISSNEVDAGRPEPYMIYKLMLAAGVKDSSRVIKVGDTEVDVNEGKNANCLYAIAVTTGAFSREEISPYTPSFIIDNMNELIPILAPLL
jgi:phosphonatase-like hydrolase